MRSKLVMCFGLLLWLGCAKGGGMSMSPDIVSEPVSVTKTNPVKVYAHYMPWFENSANGRWGMHWTMATADPNAVDADGKRQIAAHFYPLIGPYSSSDPDLIEYHLLLMKLAGIDGVLIDWYGTHDVYDYRANKRNAEALVEHLPEVGLDFAIVYEEFTAEHVAKAQMADSELAAAKADLRYMQSAYFAHDRYIRVGGAPLLLAFGPRFFETPGEWAQIFAEIDPLPHFLLLWHQAMDAGNWATGEFAWGGKWHFETLDRFYRDRVPELQTAMAAVYPGFRDYYREGGWGDGLGWSIHHEEGATLAATLERAGRSGLPFLQLVTWNDFGEGTMIEPTRRFGFSFLVQVQAFTGVDFTEADLELVYALYQARKRHGTDRVMQAELDQVYRCIVSLRLEEAAELLLEL